MDHLKELVKEYIEFQKSEFDCSDQSEEEIFENVMENVVSMVEDYSFSDYNKQKGIEMKIRFEIEVEFGKDEQKEFEDVDSFIEEMIDQHSSDFNDVSMWDIVEMEEK